MFTRMWQPGWTWAGAAALLGLALTGCKGQSRVACGGGCGGCRGPSNWPSAAGSASARRAPAAPAAAPTVDSRPYGGQKTCPVMDEPLGAMGPAIPVNVEDDTVYVCCEGCAAKIQRDPNKYLPTVKAERAGQ